MGSWDVAGLLTSLLIQIGPEGRHNPCRAREGPEWYMKSNRPGGPTQMRTRQMYRHLRGLDLSFVPIPVVNTTGKGCADPSGLQRWKKQILVGHRHRDNEKHRILGFPSGLSRAGTQLISYENPPRTPSPLPPVRLRRTGGSGE